MKSEKEKYIVNGNIYSSYEEVIEYCKANQYRVTNTTTIRNNTYLISISSL